VVFQPYPTGHTHAGLNYYVIGTALIHVQSPLAFYRDCWHGLLPTGSLPRTHGFRVAFVQKRGSTGLSFVTFIFVTIGSRPPSSHRSQATKLPRIVTRKVRVPFVALMLTVPMCIKASTCKFPAILSSCGRTQKSTPVKVDLIIIHTRPWYPKCGTQTRRTN